jgi:HlyD family secretion protein
MGVRGEILVGDRRVITYFLYPLIRALDESLREPV